MGLFSGLRGEKPPTKQNIASEIAAALRALSDHAQIHDSIDGTLAGNIILDKDSRVSFRGGEGPRDPSILAKVNFGKVRAECGKDAARDVVIFAILREFEAQCSAVRSRKALFPPTNHYVVVAKSEEYLNALARKEANELTSLTGSTSSIHLIIETYGSMGSAVVRANRLRKVFVNGQVNAFEIYH